MDKQKELDTLWKEIQAYETPKKRSGGPNLVFGEGNKDAKLMFIGEAPGYYEAQQGRPFVGNAGKLLDKLLASISINRGDVYITNVLRFRPPENRDPTEEEVTEYRPFLKRHIDIIQPLLVVTLGRFAMNYFLPIAKITRDHGKTQKAGAWTIYPVYHPAAALRDGERMRDLELDFKKIPELLAQFEKKDDNNDGNKQGQLSLI